MASLWDKHDGAAIAFAEDVRAAAPSVARYATDIRAGALAAGVYTNDVTEIEFKPKTDFGPKVRARVFQDGRVLADKPAALTFRVTASAGAAPVVVQLVGEDRINNDAAMPQPLNDDDEGDDSEVLLRTRPLASAVLTYLSGDMNDHELLFVDVTDDSEHEHRVRASQKQRGATASAVDKFKHGTDFGKMRVNLVQGSRDFSANDDWKSSQILLNLATEGHAKAVAETADVPYTLEPARFMILPKYTSLNPRLVAPVWSYLGACASPLDPRWHQQQQLDWNQVDDLLVVGMYAFGGRWMTQYSETSLAASHAVRRADYLAWMHKQLTEFASVNASRVGRRPTGHEEYSLEMLDAVEIAMASICMVGATASYVSDRTAKGKGAERMMMPMSYAYGIADCEDVALEIRALIQRIQHMPKQGLYYERHPLAKVLVHYTPAIVVGMAKTPKMEGSIGTTTTDFAEEPDKELIVHAWCMLFGRHDTLMPLFMEGTNFTTCWQKGVWNMLSYIHPADHDAAKARMTEEKRNNEYLGSIVKDWPRYPLTFQSAKTVPEVASDFYVLFHTIYIAQEDYQPVHRGNRLPDNLANGEWLFLDTESKSVGVRYERIFDPTNYTFESLWLADAATTKATKDMLKLFTHPWLDTSDMLGQIELVDTTYAPDRIASSASKKKKRRATLLFQDIKQIPPDATVPVHHMRARFKLWNNIDFHAIQVL